MHLKIHTSWNNHTACFQVEGSCEFVIPPSHSKSTSLNSQLHKKEEEKPTTDSHLPPPTSHLPPPTSLHQHNHHRMIKTSFLPGRSQSLPVSQPEPPSNEKQQGLRRRLSSSSSSSSAYTWALHRSKSLSSMGENAGTSLKKWWELSWGWILSKKPAFARDLELNEQEKYLVGTHNKGTWKHVFFKIRAEFRRILGSDNEGLPLSFRCDSKSLI